MTPRVPDEYAEMRRRQIVEAACACFVEKGFHKTTMQDIFAASGLSAGAVYTYFASKDEIVAAMAELSTRRNLAMISAAGRHDEDPIAELLREFFAFGRRPGMDRAMALDFELMSEASRNPTFAEIQRASLGEIAALLSRLVEQRQSNGLIDPTLDPAAVTYLLVAMLYGTAIRGLADPDGDPAAYEAVCRAVIDGTFSRPPGDDGRPAAPEGRRDVLRGGDPHAAQD
jgi:AcrR family transcriptional regulator